MNDLERKIEEDMEIEGSAFICAFIIFVVIGIIFAIIVW